METFKEIKGTNGVYEVSNLGTVRSNHKRGGVLKKQNDRGYHKIIISLRGKKIQVKVHRLVAETFIPNPYNKPCVNHIDGDRTNNKVTNLEWVSYLENNRHNMLNGRCWSILNAEQVKQIKIKIKEGLTLKQIAEQYNVRLTTISAIKRKQNWGHIE